MKNIKFDHTKENLEEAFNISEVRLKQLIKIIKYSFIEQEDMKSKSERIEYILEQFKPVDDTELLCMGLLAGLSEAALHQKETTQQIIKDVSKFN